MGRPVGESFPSLLPIGLTMTGTYSVQRRPIKDGLPVLHVTNGYVGQAGESQDIPLTSYAPMQETYSYRTSTEDPVNQVDPDDLRVTRNGLTTYDPEFDSGHPFWTERQSVSKRFPHVYATYNAPYGYFPFYKRAYYRGPLVPKPGFSSLSPYPGLPERWIERPGDSTDFGIRAIQNCAPTSPQAGLGQFLGELHEGFPSLIGAALLKDKAHVFRSAGSEYLNVQFGWLPFISDIQKMVKALKKATSILAQVDRDNGRVVRRRFHFPTTVETSIVDIPGEPYSPFGIQNEFLDWGPAGQRPTQLVRRSEQTVWFSGAFSYYFPVDKGLLGRAQEFSLKANRLLGAGVTPATLWELAPWSWLVDWRLNIGQNLSVASQIAFDNLVIRYGYLMRHSVEQKTYQTQPVVTNTGDSLPASFLTFSSERKERIQATPFGFGLNTANFSDGQWSILAALGMSKSRS